MADDISDDTSFTDESDFDWSPLGRDFWIAVGLQYGASAKQAKFAAAKFRGCSNTESARLAGYSDAGESGLRTAGHRQQKSNIVQLLLRTAADANGGGDDGTVTRDEARRILSGLARGSDPRVRISAIEQIGKMNTADRAERKNSDLQEPDDIAAEILSASGNYGPVIVGDAYFSEHGTIWGCPFLKELAPILVRDFPKSWQCYRATIKDALHLAEFDALANGPIVAIAEVAARHQAKARISTSESEEENAV
jgi:hypothetical protein